MSLPATLLLGFIAGVTILLGLPVGRLQRATPQLKLFLNATAVGVLLFLVWDVLSAAWEPIDAALSAQHETGRGLGSATGYGVLFAAGLSVGLLSLVFYERWMRRRLEAPVCETSPSAGAPSLPHLTAPTGSRRRHDRAGAARTGDRRGRLRPQRPPVRGRVQSSG